MEDWVWACTAWGVGVSESIENDDSGNQRGDRDIEMHTTMAIARVGTAARSGRETHSEPNGQRNDGKKRAKRRAKHAQSIALCSRLLLFFLFLSCAC